MTSRAPFSPTSATVPFVVVSSTVLPSTVAREYSSGELPRSNPAIGRILRSPASSTSPRSNCFARSITSSELSNGITALAPFESATATVDEARSTSITSTTRPWTSAGVSRCPPKNTSRRTSWAPS